MSDTIVISNKITNSIISNYFVLNPEIMSNALFYYFGFNSERDAIIPIPPQTSYSESFLNMIASEDALKKNWDNPVEDEVWAHL